MNHRPEIWALPVLAAVVIVAAVFDARKGKIPNAVTYPAILIGLTGQWLTGGSDGLVRALLGLAAGFGPLAVCWACGGLGGGDVKLMGAVGALTNWKFTVAGLFCGLAVAVVMAVFVMIRRRIVRRTLGRIWRAVWVALAPGVKGGGPATTDSPKIPFGVALCIGVGGALVDGFLGGPLASALLGN